ncbi:hypothetical protein BCV69DRAFT_264967 [Microstroma glucosiphilum]|uniref:PH domain-containing protein n=1 Tax=Pseudomicrostroma glucosiphilum TaxID=1684307 RepID=A0A316UKG9_9BASI|nr:hypothetical protein BCV69DRAFT_264967 [Pseudomicrostroma glucosiphilum]PWN23725.1 hypothetical protein BCV69DRAFT_264967 [Pseudomicrostroma glucosiphilum]
MPQRSYSQHEGMKIEEDDIVHAGYVLKKKRKKMQGYAKRFLILTKQGNLTYAVSRDKPIRDSINVPNASVTSSKRNGTLHVDSGQAVFHLKMLSAADFDLWHSHLRSFIPEQSFGSDQKIYVSSNGGSDVSPVDLSPVFNSCITVGKLVQEVQAQVGNFKKASQSSGGIVESMTNLGRPSKSDEALEALSNVAEQLAAEHANLTFALQSRIPKTKAQRSMKGMHSDLSASSLSINSFQSNGTGEGIFFDADAADGSMNEDEAQDESQTGSSDGVDEDDSEESDREDDGKPVQGEGKTKPSSDQVQYRKQLPSKVSGEETSLFSMLKKNAGKDLSTISFPVSFNCPLSLLQAACEEMEYAPDLLERASETKDWVERICLVTAFAVSSYSSTKLRASRKPFNPLLGETFECVREDKHLRFIAEKVVHQPPIVASYAEGNGWHLSAWSAVKNKFWGKSMELIPEGQSRLEFDDGDAFTFNKPSSFMRNLLAGNKYLEHVGELTVTNANTGQKAVVEFKEGNMWGSTGSRNAVQGDVYDENGKKVTGLKGKWSDNFARQKDKENYQVLWEAAEMPPSAEDYYGFTYFAMSLNELTDDAKPFLPPTDTRLRPDQRAFEEGDVDKAEQTKQSLEGSQRERRKKMESKKQKHEPRWFHEAKGEEPEWKYGGKMGEYFAKRKEIEEGAEGKKAWKGVPDLFNE